jgi:hypothetical protein
VYWNLRALAALDGRQPVARRRSAAALFAASHPTRAVGSAFDLAFARGASALARRPSTVSFDACFASSTPTAAGPAPRTCA